jgi:hypothetical protein
MTEEDLELALSLLAGRIKPSPWGAQAMSLNHGLHFTGGEPFLNFDLLRSAVQMAEALQIPSIFVETNCFWCRNDKVTRDKLTDLRDAGLKGILISVNPFYVEYIPFERTERCIDISREVLGDHNVMVYQLQYYRQFKELGIRGRITLEDYLQRTGGAPLAKRVELFLMGRATRQLRCFYPRYPARRFFDEPCRPSFLRHWHNHFDNYGNFVPGYCGGIALGDWHALNVMLQDGIDLEMHPVLRFLIAEDIRALLAFAEARGYQVSQDGYLSKCDLCLDIRMYLVTMQDFAELKPRAFYEHLEKRKEDI